MHRAVPDIEESWRVERTELYRDIEDTSSWKVSVYRECIFDRYESKWVEVAGCDVAVVEDIIDVLRLRLLLLLLLMLVLL